MPSPYRDYFRAAYPEGLVVDIVYIPIRSPGIFLFCKGISVFQPERFLYIRFAVYFGRAFFQIVEGSDVIKTSGVVLVIVCQQNSIQMGNIFSEHLLPEVRACVHEQLQTVIIHHNTGSEPFVPMVGTSAYFASAADHRHTLRCSGS